MAQHSAASGAVVMADCGYASHVFRMLIRDLGSRPVIPTKRDEVLVACPHWICNNRNLVERYWPGLKDRAAKRIGRAVATGYEKAERFFMTVLCMAATMDWLKA